MTRRRVTWTADRDGQAHAAISRHPRTPCGRRPIDPRFGWPETQPRCAVCRAAAEDVARSGRKATAVAGQLHPATTKGAME